MTRCNLITGQIDSPVSIFLNENWARLASINETVVLWLQPRPQKERITGRTFGKLTELNATEVSQMDVEEATCWGDGWQLTLYRQSKTSTRTVMWICDQSPLFESEHEFAKLMAEYGSIQKMELQTDQRKVSFDGGKGFESVTTYLQSEKLKWFHF